MLKNLRPLFSRLLLLSFLSWMDTSVGATLTWSGATSNDWATGSNWGGSAPTSSDTAQFQNNTPLFGDPEISGTESVGLIAFNSSSKAYNLTIDQSSSLSVEGASITAFATSGGTHSITNNGTLTINFNGTVIGNSSNAGWLELNNAGVVMVTADNVQFYTKIQTTSSSADINFSGGSGEFFGTNTYTASSTITLGSTSGSSSGHLSLEVADALGSGSSAPNIRFTNASNVLDFDAPISYVGNMSSYNVSGAGVVNFNEDVSLSGSILAPGTLVLEGEIATGKTLTFEGTGDDFWSSGSGSTLNIQGTGRIVFDRGDNPDFSGVISNSTAGSGTLEALQSVRLDNAGNTFTGNLQVDSGADLDYTLGSGNLSGTLTVGGSGTNSAGTRLYLTLKSGSTLSGNSTVNNGAEMLLDNNGIVTLTGSLTVNPGGNLICIIESSATVNMSSDVTVDGSGTASSTFYFDLSEDTTASGLLSANGGTNSTVYVQGGFFTLTLSNPSLNYAGAVVVGQTGESFLSTLLLGNNATDTFGSISGAGQLDLGTNTTLTVNQTVDGSFTPSAVSGSGTIAGGTGDLLEKQGSATLIVDGEGTGGFETDVVAGTLIVGSSSTYDTANLGEGEVTVESGATLGGYGTVGTTTNNGTVRAGYFPTLSGRDKLANGLGALTLAPLTIVGNYTQSSSGILELIINAAGDSNYLDISGTASLNGTLSVSIDDGFDPDAVYTVLTAGSVSGEFSTITVSGGSGLQGFRPNYSSTLVSLLVFFDPTAIASAAQTYNQRSFGTYLSNVSLPAAMDDLFASISAAQYPSVADQVSGATYANQQMELAKAGNWFTSRLADRFFMPHCVLLNETERNLRKLDYYCSKNKRLWVVAGAGQDQLQSDTVSGLNTTTENLAIGVETNLTPNTQVGVALAANHFQGKATVRETADNQGNLFQAGIYFQYVKSHWFFGMSFDAGATDNVHVERVIDTLPGAVQTQSNYRAGIFGEQARMGYHGEGRVAFYPFIGVVGQQVLRPQVVEMGGSGFDLSVNASNYLSFRSQVGFELKINKSVQPFVVGVWEHEFGDRAGDFDAQAMGSPDTSTTFHIIGQTVGRDIGVVQAGFRILQREEWYVDVFYEGSFTNAWLSNAGNLAINVVF